MSARKAVSQYSDKGLLYLLLASLLFSFYFNIGNVPLFDVDEGAFTEATREMFERGDFISTYLNGAPRYDKPILIYWLQALSVSQLGYTEFALRLPSALAATLWVMLVVWFMIKVSDRRTAYIAGIITATSCSISLIGKAATADALLNCWLAGSMLAFYLFYTRWQKSFLYLMYVFCALGFLTKGPVAILIPFAVSFIFLGIRRQWSAWLTTVFNPLGWWLFIVIAGPWYMLQYLKEGQAFFDGFFLKHNIDRFQGPMEGHVGSILYYVPVVLIGMMPFTSVIFGVFRQIKTIITDDLQLYLLIWFGFVIVFFSLSGTKLPHYANYGLTGLCILMALYLPRMRLQILIFLPFIIFMGGLMTLPWWFGYVLAQVQDPHYQMSLMNYEQYFSIFYTSFFVMALGIVSYFMFERHYALADKLLTSGVLSAFTLSAVIVPVFGAMLQAPVKEAALLAKQNHYNVVMWRINMPSFSLYRQQVTERREPVPGDVVLTSSAYLDQLSEHQVLYRKNGIALVKIPIIEKSQTPKQ